MKKSEILIGKTYSNGKEGRFYSERKVIDMANDGRYKLYAGQTDPETVKYQTVKGVKSGNGIITLTRFALWAKSIVE